MQNVNASDTNIIRTITIIPSELIIGVGAGKTVGVN